MLPLSLLLCAIVALATAQDRNHTRSLAAAGCPAGWSQHKNRCFFFDATLKTWVQAEARCQQIGGNLASVASDDEYAFIQTLTQNPTWLGGSDCQTAGAWFWMDGQQMKWRFWCPLKPDNLLPQCCMQMNVGGDKCWDDVPCSSTLPFVCARSLQGN
ncbi:type-2 ice-structuring protein-like [Phyllopteryx taeniolatus]|uniref:type-2 ice-structuring protein-like n=1 Tax=Phyllopteryx taeniolatus TaxID=161469 RepID=UPI002AD55741|nr:type-2 ice-structuring protein-like [Phyllopteryx taeniolatus]XP_061627203.1 type-2 ice-structuring protein-like [Phyllopteryx taeniolatus]XP_061627209.1 type-2 ice-structuring protein-like [Phyllopteryx taeniolatus]